MTKQKQKKNKPINICNITKQNFFYQRNKNKT